MSLQKLFDSISASLIERDREINAILMGLIAQEHVLLVGPPGTAKSTVCRSLAASISGCRYCERLLSPTTPPEHLFGPPDVKGIQEGVWRHIGTGTVTDAEIVFLDEFFRGSDAIRDTMLHLLGPERQALIGTEQVHIPLLTAVGASNSWSDSADQQAILDRWLIRLEVKPVSPAARERLLFDTLPSVTPSVTLDEIKQAHQDSLALPIAQEAKECYQNILGTLHQEGIRPSDRRQRKSVLVARAAAILDGAKEVQPHHLEPLGMVLWDVPGEQAEKASIIVAQISNPVGAKLTEILKETDQIIGAAADTPTRMAAVKKLEEMEKAANKVSGGNGRAAKVLQYIKDEKTRLVMSVLKGGK